MDYRIKSKSTFTSNYITFVSGVGELLLQPLETEDKQNQLWEFVPNPTGPSYYFIIQNKLTGNVLTNTDPSWGPNSRGLSLASLETNATDQLWEFLAGPAGSGDCFIRNVATGNLITPQQFGDDEGLVVSPWVLGSNNQLWTAGGQGFPSVVDTVPQPGGGYSGSANYLMAFESKCAPLTGVKATIVPCTPIIAEGLCSIQLNAWTERKQPIDFLQFSVYATGLGLQPGIKVWFTPDNVWNVPLENVILVDLFLQQCSFFFIVIALEYVESGVVGATWTALDAALKTVGSFTYIMRETTPSPVASFQVTFGGVGDTSKAVFSAGSGVIIYEAAAQDGVSPITAQTSYPDCVGFTSGSAETSNMAYGPLEAMESFKFTQAFGVL